MGSLCRPPNTDENQSMKAKSCEGKVQPEIVLGINHNMDLLKNSQHKPTNIFLETLS